MTRQRLLVALSTLPMPADPEARKVAEALDRMREKAIEERKARARRTP